MTICTTINRLKRQRISFYALLLSAFFIVGPLGNVAHAAGACPSSYQSGDVFAIVRPPAFKQFDEFIASAEVKDTLKFIEVIHGRLASPAEWPATLILCMADQTFCTTTLVGPRVFLTAAHCFDHVRSGGASIHGTVQLPPGGAIGITCTVDPEYAPMGTAAPDSSEMQRPWSADIAVCKAENDIPISLSERIVPSSAQPIAGSLITLLGFGCSSPGGGGVVQVLYAGPTSIRDVGTATYFIHTWRTALGPAALCSGDSGGASFTSASATRAINGINAIADNKEESWITDLSRSEIREFVAQQTADPQLHVCGLHADAKACRPL